MSHQGDDVEIRYELWLHFEQVGPVITVAMTAAGSSAGAIGSPSPIGRTIEEFEQKLIMAGWPQHKAKELCVTLAKEHVVPVGPIRMTASQCVVLGLRPHSSQIVWDLDDVETWTEQLKGCPAGAIGERVYKDLSQFLNQCKQYGKWNETCDRAQRAVVDFVRRKVAAEYELAACSPASLKQEELDRCAAIIKEGGAVDPQSAERELRVAALVVVARVGGEIVGVGAIKRIRREYASQIATASGVEFDQTTPELGYVSVDPTHRNKGLSRRITAELVGRSGGKLFATTDDPFMKKTLMAAGFVQRGSEWEGRRGKLSLWVRDAYR